MEKGDVPLLFVMGVYGFAGRCGENLRLPRNQKIFKSNKAVENEFCSAIAKRLQSDCKAIAKRLQRDCDAIVT
jgi:uncharacterized C2H2 Zn-finger protein